MPGPKACRRTTQESWRRFAGERGWGWRDDTPELMERQIDLPPITCGLLLVLLYWNDNKRPDQRESDRG
jgi:hypothetical protein